MPEKSLGIIGAGNMGSAIVQGVLTAGFFAPEQIVVCDVIKQKADGLSRKLGVRNAPSAAEIPNLADTLIIAIKPQTMEQGLGEIKNAIRPSHLVLSIAAGIPVSFIEERLPPLTRVIRVMPNTPALVGAGATAICAGSHASEEDMTRADTIFSGIGTVYRVSESLMNTVTAVSGSGPAYLFYFAECLSEAAVQNGLPQRTAVSLVMQTLYGASRLLLESGEEAQELRAKVTSPGGTTEAALKTFSDRGFKEIIVAAVNSAIKRGRELGGAKD